MDGNDATHTPALGNGSGAANGNGSATTSNGVGDVGEGGDPSLLATSTIGHVVTPPTAAPVPDVLLSLAKDDRYIAEVTSLLSRVAVPFASIFLLPLLSSINRASSSFFGNSGNASSRRNGTTYDDQEVLEDDGERFIERIRPELKLVAAAIVHSATFIFYSRNFGNGNGIPEANENGKSTIRRSLGMESLNLAYRHPASKRRNELKPSTLASRELRSNNNKMTNLFRYYSRAIIPSWSMSRWHRLLFLQTVVPYIIERAGRGGWSKDLGELLSILLERCGFIPTRRLGVGSRSGTINTGSDNGQIREDEDSAVLRNDDRLRGSARRRLFEEQHRRMIHSSISAISDLDSDSNGGQSLGVTDVNEIRRDSASFGANGDRIAQVANSRSLGHSSFGRRLKRLSSLSWNVLRRISLAVSSLNHGAHSLPRHANTGQYLDRYTKIIRWFLRLHLALFYWNGAYPTMAHRLAGAQIRDSVAPHSTGASFSPMVGAIIANRPTYKPIAALILMQAVAALVQKTAEASIEAAHFVQVWLFRWRRQRQRMEQQQQQQLNLNRTNLERTEYMELIEESVPGIASSTNKDGTKIKHTTKPKKERNLKMDTQPCGVCLNERVNPAAPSGCGHVFCWNCVLHWVSNVRAECPLCRARTRPQDILPLYNYP